MKKVIAIVLIIVGTFIATVGTIACTMGYLWQRTLNKGIVEEYTCPHGNRIVTYYTYDGTYKNTVKWYDKNENCEYVMCDCD